MNIEVSKKTIVGFLKDTVGIADDNITVETNSNNVRVTAQVTTKVVDDDIHITIQSFQNGVFLIRFTLDKIGKTLSNYNLINTYNQNVAWFKTSINDDNYLVFEHVSFDVSSESVLEEIVQFFFNKFVKEKHVKYLKPLADITQ